MHVLEIRAAYGNIISVKMNGIIKKLKTIFRNGPPVVIFPVLIAILVVSAAFLKFRKQIVVARVNGSPIYRWELVSELEENYGSQALNSLVVQKIVYQEAEKHGVSVGSEEVEEEIGKLESTAQAQGANLDQVLGMYGVNRSGLEETLRYQLLVTKLADADVSVSDEEIDQYWEETQDQFGEGTKKEDVVETLRESLSRQKADQKISEWLQNLQENAEVKQYLTFE